MPQLRRPWGLPLAVLGAQLVLLLAFWGVAELSYGDRERRLGASLERPLALGLLALAGPVALAALVVGLQRLFARASWARAAAWTVFLYSVPLLVGGAGSWLLRALW